MKAVCWTGVGRVAVETVPDPVLVNPRDALVRVTATTLCGSDLHILDGRVPTVARGDVLGHEFMGEVVEVGPEVRRLRPGDRVVVSAVIACGSCYFCERGLFSLCDNTNPTAQQAERAWGQAPCGTFGSTLLAGGYAGSLAELVRVPFAEVGCRKVPAGIPEERLLFLSDALPTGYMGADLCQLAPGATVAVWGAGAVGLFALLSARLLGAERLFAIDRVPERLEVARVQCGAEVLDATRVDVQEALRERTAGRGPDACIDAVGMEAQESGWQEAVERARALVHREVDRPYVLREAIQACRKGGTVAIMGAYGGRVDGFPIGAAMNKGLTLRTGQLHAQRYLDRLLGLVERGEVDPSFVATHTLRLEEAQHAFELFKHRREGCLRVVFKS